MTCTLRFKKDVLILKILLCFGSCAFGLEVIPHPCCYLTFIVEKTHHGPVIAPFSVLLQLFFCYIGGVLVSELPTFFTVIDSYILAIEQTVTHEEHLR